MQTITRPLIHRARDLEGTCLLVAAIADDLRRLYGGSGRMDEAGAERHLRFIVAQARKEAARPDAAAHPDAPVRAPTGLPGRRAFNSGGPARRSARNMPRRMLDPLLTIRGGLVARVRGQIADDSYESEEKLEAALCGLADEMGI